MSGLAAVFYGLVGFLINELLPLIYVLYPRHNGIVAIRSEAFHYTPLMVFLGGGFFLYEGAYCFTL